MIIRRQLITVCYYCIIFLLLSSPFSLVFAQAEEDKQVLLMYFKKDELLVEAPTRSPEPVSRVAENVTVITARDIERMNAHTVAEVLNTVTGVQVLITSGPGSPASAIYIQGSEPTHVTVLIDGVYLNNPSDNVVDLGTIPVQNIEKIEIVKGPASSAWGSALGGIVNIITKTSRPVTGADGLVSASYGERNTGDFRAETRGRQGVFGYYLNAGRLQTNGLTPNFDVSNNNAYAKLTYAATNKTDLMLAAGFTEGSRGIGEFSDLDLSLGDEFRYFRSTLAVKTSLTDETDLHFSIWSIRQNVDFINSQTSTGNRISLDNYTDHGFGSSAKLIYRGQTHHLVFGVDQHSRTLNSNRIAGEEQAIRKAAVYLNDTMSLDKLSITPGVRFDYTSSNGSIVSPSLGLTYQAPGTTTIRIYAAQGFGIPPLAYTFGDNRIISSNPELNMERVLSYQIGAETAAINTLWMKVALFRHEVQDAIIIERSPSSSQAVNDTRQRRLGMEAELKTAPFYNTSLTAGVLFVAIKDLSTGLIIETIPRKTYDVGVVYDDEISFHAQLKGRYIDWNYFPSAQGNYGNIIFDLNVADVIYSIDTESLEVFANAHNIFKGSQYTFSFYKNPSRWVETGIRYRF